MMHPDGNNGKNWVMCVEAPTVAMQDYGEPERPYRIVDDELSRFR